MDRPSDRQALVASGRALEDSFFQEQDRELIACRAKLVKMAESKAALASVSGIQSEDILQRLVDLNVRPETLAALSAVPLIEVVWADGHVDEAERKAVLAFAAGQGVAEGTLARELLERWLAHRPPPDLLVAWQHHIEALCERLSSEELDVLRSEVLRNVRAAARASGGFLGVGAISRDEEAVIAKLEASFC